MTTHAEEQLVTFAYFVIGFAAGCVLGDVVMWVLQ